MSKEEKIDALLDYESSERLSVPIEYWIGTKAQQYAVARSIKLRKPICYNPLEDEELKEYAELTGIPIDKCVFDQCIYDFIKYGKELPLGSYYSEFKEQWEKRRK
jgi:hypothetical protein